MWGCQTSKIVGLCCVKKWFFYFIFLVLIITKICNSKWECSKEKGRVFYNISSNIMRAHTHIKLEIIYFSPMIKSINEKSFKVNLRSCDYSVCWWEDILWVWLLFSLVIAFLLNVFFINCSNYTASVTVKKGKNNCLGWRRRKEK